MEELKGEELGEEIAAEVVNRLENSGEKLSELLKRKKNQPNKPNKVDTLIANAPSASNRPVLGEILHNTGGTDATDEPNCKKVRRTLTASEEDEEVRCYIPNNTSFSAGGSLLESPQPAPRSFVDVSLEGCMNNSREDASGEVDIGHVGDSMHPGINGV